MARTIGRLSEMKARNAKPQGEKTRGNDKGRPRDTLLLCDGGGLYLQATLGKDGNVRRSWIFRYKRRGAPLRDMGLGSLNDVGMGDARDAARNYRKLVKEGIDPIADRDSRIARNLAVSAAVVTFKQAAETYIAQHRPGWKNSVHAAQWPSSLQTYAYPIVGRMSVADIETEHVKKVLDPIWMTKTETGKRLRGRIEAILGWATANGYRKDQNGHDRPNPARWRGHLDKLLAAPSKVRKVKHQAALTYDEMPAFMVDLRSRKGIAPLALEFTILTCVRTTDVRRAKRENIDRAGRVWIIPEFTKTGREHRVPLSDAALALLDKVQKTTSDIRGTVAQSEFMFPNDVTGAALSSNAMLAVLDRMGRKGQMTTHGCRSTFRTWAQEKTNFPWELAEMSLGHTVGSKVERAYARGDALKKRYGIMQAWTDFCARTPQTSKVIPLLSRGA